MTTNDAAPALRIAGLHKAYGRPAVDGLDLLVRRGELSALLGPNGAGKTTTLRMVSGLVAPDAGRIEVLGIDLGGIRVDMTMTAAEVEGSTFAVGTALAPDATMARATLPAMRQALLRNIGATLESTAAAPEPGKPLTVNATGKGNGGPVRLVGRFVAKGARVYQVIVIGKPNAMPPEQTDQFLSSFAPQ